MNAKKLIDMSLAYSGMTKKELATKLGQSPQQFNQRLITGKFTLEEWNQIAAALNAKAEFHIVFDDGHTI